MIIYNAKTKKVPLNLKEWNLLNTFKCVERYDSKYIIVNGNTKSIVSWDVASDIHFTYNTMVKFNNDLINGNNQLAFDSLYNMLQEHPEIKNSIDYKCRNYYNEMYSWYNVYINYPTEKTYKRICDEIQKTLNHLCKQGIVQESSCNLKRNYY